MLAISRRLQLRLYYTSRKPVTENPRSWPPSLPIAMWYPPGATSPPLSPNDEGNFFAILEHHDEINLVMTPVLFERSTALRQGLFPALEKLRLKSPDSAYRPLLQCSFLLRFLVHPSHDYVIFNSSASHFPHDPISFSLLGTWPLFSLLISQVPTHSQQKCLLITCLC